MHAYPDGHHFPTRVIQFHDDYAPTLSARKLKKWLWRRSKVFARYGEAAGLTFVEGAAQLHLMKASSGMWSYAAWAPMTPTPAPGHITEGRVYLYRSWAFAHELGHVLGLQHRFADVFSCMSYSQWPWPDAHDLASVAAICAHAEGGMS